MSKKAILAVFCIAALFFCHGIEKKVYKSRTFSYYQQKKLEKEEKTQVGKEVLAVNQLVNKAIEENQLVQKEQKVAYLTFDDGPSKVTREVLKTLKEHNIHATFFLIGSQITADMEEIVKQLAEDGHTIGIHTYTHKGKEIYQSKDAYLEDFEKAADRIEEVTGQRPTIFRFPWGSTNKYLKSIGKDVITELESRGYTYYDWNVSAEDSVGKPTRDSILRNINKDYKKYNHPIILMHDSSINELSAQTLPQIISNLKDSGYQFDTLDHLEKPYQYPRK